MINFVFRFLPWFFRYITFFSFIALPLYIAAHLWIEKYGGVGKGNQIKTHKKNSARKLFSFAKSMALFSSIPTSKRGLKVNG